MYITELKYNMLLHIPYKQNGKRKNIRYIAIFTSCLLLCFLFRKHDHSQKIQYNLIPYIAPIEMPYAESGIINLLTYNIAGLPEIISSAQTPRAESIGKIGEYINQFDIVNVQEDFNYNDYLYKNNTHPYRSIHKGIVPFGDGLSTLSKYPITTFERVAWNDCTGADCLTPKGFTLSRIQIAKDINIDVYNLHTTAEDDLNSCLARQKNINQLIAYIDKHSAENPLIIMGDFNAHYSFNMDNIRELNRHLGTKDTWLEIFKNGELPQVTPNFVAQPKLSLTSDMESIDKILFRNSSKVKIEPKSYHIEKELFSNLQGLDLSDHCAISSAIVWTRLN